MIDIFMNKTDVLIAPVYGLNLKGVCVCVCVLFFSYCIAIAYVKWSYAKQLISADNSLC